MLQTWDLGEMLKATIGQAHSSRKQSQAGGAELVLLEFYLSAERKCINRGVLSPITNLDQPSSKQLRTIFFPCCFALALLLVIQIAQTHLLPLFQLYTETTY